MVLRGLAKAFYNNVVPPSKDGGNSSGKNWGEEIKMNEYLPNEFPLASASGIETKKPNHLNRLFLL